jgi:hypothetical protein
MATSIHNLLTALDDELTPDGPTTAVADAAAASERTGRLIRHLIRNGLDPVPGGPRERRAGALATAAVNLGQLWPTDPGRCAALVGALADTVGKLEHELTRSDRWHTTIRLSSVITRCASVLRDSGPYRHLPELLVADRSATGLLRIASADPPDPERTQGITRPIPATVATSDPGEQLHESLSVILDHLNQHGRPDLTGRQIIATARVGRAISARPVAAGHNAAEQWRFVLVFAAHIHDPQPSGTDRILEAAAAISRIAKNRRAARPALLNREGGAPLRAGAELLPRLAAALAHDLRTRRRPLILAPGAEPVSEARVGEWLARTTFLATRRDIEPVVQLLDTIVEHRLPVDRLDRLDHREAREPATVSIVPTL